MRWLGILLALLTFLGGESWAVVSINSQGSSLAPVSITTAAEVIPPNASRRNWTIYSESQPLRCTAGTYSQASGAFTAPATAPTASVGFYIPAATYVSERELVFGPYTSGPNAFARDEAKVEVDCISQTGVATSVDTWEDLAR